MYRITITTKAIFEELITTELWDSVDIIAEVIYQSCKYQHSRGFIKFDKGLKLYCVCMTTGCVNVALNIVQLQGCGYLFTGCLYDNLIILHPTDVLVTSNAITVLYN